MNNGGGDNAKATAGLRDFLRTLPEDIVLAVLHATDPIKLRGVKTKDGRF